MWLANVRPSPGSAPNVHPRARPITDLRPNTRIIEILPRLNPPLHRHLLQSRRRRLVPPPRPVQRPPRRRRRRLARHLIRPRRLVRRPNQQASLDNHPHAKPSEAIQNLSIVISFSCFCHEVLIRLRAERSTSRFDLRSNQKTQGNKT
jgi:hypothetical protein